MTSLENVTNHSGRTTGVGNCLSKGLECCSEHFTLFDIASFISPDGNRVTIFTHFDV